MDQSVAPPQPFGKPESAQGDGLGYVAPSGGSVASAAGVGAAGALPCLGSHNNSGGHVGLTSEGLVMLGTHAGLSTFCRVTETGLTSSQRRSLFALRENLEAHIDAIGVNHVAFLTVTSKDRFGSAKEFQKKVFNVFTSADTFGRHFGKWYRVFEPHQSGDWHAHLLVETHEDILTGVDLGKLREAIASKDRAKRSRLYRDFAPKDHPIRDIWRDLRRLTAVSKCIGRMQVEPIRSNAEGVGKYLSKYLQKGVLYRKAWSDGERVRLWAKSKDAERRVSCQFAWASEKSTLWRRKLAIVADHFDLPDYGAFGARWGPRWAYWLGPWVREIDADQPLVSRANDTARGGIEGQAWALESRDGLSPSVGAWRRVWAKEDAARARDKAATDRLSELVRNGWRADTAALER